MPVLTYRDCSRSVPRFVKPSDAAFAERVAEVHLDGAQGDEGVAANRSPNLGGLRSGFGSSLGLGWRRLHTKEACGPVGQPPVPAAEEGDDRGC